MQVTSIYKIHVCVIVDYWWTMRFHAQLSQDIKEGPTSGMCLRSPPVEAPHCHCTLLAPTACYCRLFSLSLSLQAGVWLPRSNTPINISMLCYSPHTAHACSRGTFTHYFILVLGRFEAWISAFSKCSFSILTPEELRFKRPWAFMSYLIWVHNSKSEFLDSIYLQKAHLDTILPQQHF